MPERMDLNTVHSSTLAVFGSWSAHRSAVDVDVGIATQREASNIVVVDGVALISNSRVFTFQASIVSSFRASSTGGRAADQEIMNIFATGPRYNRPRRSAGRFPILLLSSVRQWCATLGPSLGAAVLRQLHSISERHRPPTHSDHDAACVHPTCIARSASGNHSR